MFGFGFKEKKEPWRNGVYLTTARSSIEADILESKLASIGVPCLKRYEGASNFLEIAMGSNNVFPIEILVPEQYLEEALEIIKPVAIEDDFIEAFEGDEEIPE